MLYLNNGAYVLLSDAVLGGPDIHLQKKYTLVY